MRLTAFVLLLPLAFAARAGAGVDHAAFDAVLRKHVTEQNLVRYADLKRDQAGLDAYLAQLATVDLDKLDRDERLATLLNAYNAFTLKLVAERYPIKSLKNDVPEAERWKAVRWNLGGRTVSLDQIEHEMIRPVFNEPRVHFALVCAAIDCPPLRREAYVGAKLEQQLADQMRQTHAGGRTKFATYDPSANTLRLSSLYKWFAKDFQVQAPDVVAFVSRHVAPLAEALKQGRKPAVTFADYDWTLNDAGR